MPIHTFLGPFGQVLRKLCLFEPSQSREPLPRHCCSRALSRDNAPLKLGYISLLTPPNEVFLSILEFSRHELCIAHGFTLTILSPLRWEAFPTVGGSPTLGSLGPSYHRRNKSRVSLRGSSCAHGVFGHPLWTCAQQIARSFEINISIWSFLC
jgi:hypothetical protein